MCRDLIAKHDNGYDSALAFYLNVALGSRRLPQA